MKKQTFGQTKYSLGNSHKKKAQQIYSVGGDMKQLLNYKYEKDYIMKAYEEEEKFQHKKNQTKLN